MLPIDDAPFSARSRRSSAPATGPRRGRPAGSRRDEGAILIVALGVLTLLSVLGATFAQLMSLEKKAAQNYVEAQHMDMLTDSAIDTVVAQLHDWSNRRSWTAYSSVIDSWLYILHDEQALAHGRVPIESDRVGRWTTYSEMAGKRFRFKTKVIDCAAQINLNGRQDTLARMLDHLGEAIARSRRLSREDGRVVTNPFYTEPNRGGKKVRGEDIMLFRQRLEGQRFQSKSQIKLLIGEQNYSLVKDFLTCWSWEDPYTYAPSDGIDEVRDLATGLTTVGGGAGGGAVGGGQAQQQPPASDKPRLRHEPRHPINVNTAPEEVLIACLQGLAGRRVFPYSQLGIAGGGLQAIDQAADIRGQRLVFGKEEVRNVLPRAIYVYSPALQYTHAQRIAQRIIQHRKEPRNTFRAWRTNDISQPGFEDFVNGLETDFFPSPGNVRVIDPKQPQNNRLKGRITGSGTTSPIGRLWARGTAQSTARQVLRNRGHAVHDRFAWYYELVKSVLKSNFNPNTRINRYNPNAPAYVPVDKSGLVWAESREVLKKGYTTEFCFDTMGVYEITTLGEMLDLSRLQQSSARTVTAGSGEIPGDLTFPFRRKVRTVVRVFDVLRHTNQMHFEKTFQSGSRASANDRRYVVTWPEPMEALTELYTMGSQRDGRVELAGQLDGIRSTIPVRNRQTFTGKHPDVLAEQSFLIRSPRSISQLRQVLRQGGGTNAIVGDAVTNRLRDVLDFDWSRQSSRVEKYYRRNEMSALGVFAGNQAVWNDPIVGREEVSGLDLFPDGLNSSILRMPHLGSRHIVLPARQRIGDVGGAGGNSKVGASGRGTRGQNVRGNVAYYKGGVGFWVKFDFDGDDPVFSGLIGCTQVIEDVSPNAADYTGSEGQQFFIFKNSVGQLRIVRMYYHQAFPEFGGGGDGGGGGGGGGVRLHPDDGTAGANVNNPDNPILEHLDPQKWVSRSDILVDIKHFKAHEWHHIAVDWDDQNMTYPVRLFMDFEEVREASPRLPQEIVDGTANSWVRLNEKQPKDGLQLPGFVRSQGVEDAGVFKWFTNTASFSSGGGGRSIVAPSIKRILANATIDDLITYQGTFHSAKTYYGGRGQPGYFTNQTGEYANVFEVPLPPDVHGVTLRSFDWTSYYPTVYTDSRPSSRPMGLPVTTPINCEVTFNGPSLPRQTVDPWRQPTVDNFVSGKRVIRRDTGVLTNAEVVYKFTFQGARSPSGATAGGVVQTPVIDDVTLTYFLTSPEILLQEES